MASFLSEVETGILGQLSAVEGAAFGLASAARPAFIVGLVIWITLTGYEVAFGKTQDSVSYILTKLGKMLLIGTLALFAWPDIANLLGGLKDAAMGAGGAAGVIETRVLTPLENLWDAMDVWFATATQSFGWTDITKYFGVLFVYALMIVAFLVLALIAGAMAAISFGMFMIAQVVFALHLAVGPFFLLCLIFPFTQRFFETYIGSAMTTIFALALTAIVLNLGANVLGLDGALASALTGPSNTTDAGFITFARGAATLFLAKAGAAALLIYMFFKVWDLAAALGGGLNMGNNLVGGVRAIMNDLSSKGGAGRSTTQQNTINQGNSTGGASGKAAAANAGMGSSTFTGAALRGAGAAAAPAARLAAAGASNLASMASYGAGRAAGAVGRFAYNRYSQNSNRISSS
jgi:type IV secretion system protein VirB6